jgi:hypothetical protein
MFALRDSRYVAPESVFSETHSLGAPTTAYRLSAVMCRDAPYLSPAMVSAPENVCSICVGGVCRHVGLICTRLMAPISSVVTSAKGAPIATVLPDMTALAPKLADAAVLVTA